jgi:subtilisin family serine protease
MQLRVLLASSAVAGLSFLTTQGTAQSPVGPPEFVPNQVLVQFRADATPALRASARARVGGVREEVVVAAIRRNDGKGDLELMRIAGLAVSDAARRLAEDSAVEFAEPNWIYQHQATSNDPSYSNGSLWGMYGDGTMPANQFGSQAGEAWARGNVGSGTVYVGIIDEGVMRNHDDLNPNMWVNPVDNTVNGVDEDGNGFVDDVHGWDFDGRNNTVYDGTQDDHGTHVAGTIGAVGGNASGVAGVNWNVVMIPAKFLGRRGGTTANAIKAVDYLTDLKIRHGIYLVATNNSWGGGGFSQGLLDAIDRGGDEGILFVAAAGNGGNDGVGDNNDTTASYPSNYECTSNQKTWDCVIAVAALTSTGAKSGFSNYGSSTVDLGAPGSGIYSTVPGKQNNSSYASYSGTSMATPHVTGAAALYGASHFGASAAAIKQAILTSAIATPSMAGRTTTGGRLNVSGF